MDDILRRLGKRIREIRIERGFGSQEAFADYLGIHRTFMGHLETGRKDFRLTTLIRVANALELTLADLFAGLEGGAGIKKARKAPASKGNVDRSKVLREVASLERTMRNLKEIAVKEEESRKVARDAKGSRRVKRAKG